MDAVLRAIEVEGSIDAQRQLHLDHPLPVAAPGRVRVIILISEPGKVSDEEWLRAAARNPAFDFLRDPAEDVYTVEDGEPFCDQR
jgi:hypothetical protein